MSEGRDDGMTAAGTGWTITPEDVEAVCQHLMHHFPGGRCRVLTESSDPGQLFQVVDREGARYTVKILREALDDLRGRKVPLARFLAKHEIARRLRRDGRLVVLRARGEDMFRKGDP